MFYGREGLLGVAHRQKVTLAKESLGVGPRRRDQGDAAGKSLKDTDGWNSGHRSDILLTRNVHCDARSGVGRGAVEIREIATVPDSGTLERAQGSRWIAHAVDGET